MFYISDAWVISLTIIRSEFLLIIIKSLLKVHLDTIFIQQ